MRAEICWALTARPMFNQCLAREAIAKYVGEAHVQHNAYVADDKEAFIESFNRMRAHYSEKEWRCWPL